MTTCTRTGCNKKLRKDNSKGMCSSACESPDAPPAQRAKGVEGRGLGNPPAKQLVEPSESGAALKKFREVAETVGLDADKVLEEFAQSWLDGLREKLA